MLLTIVFRYAGIALQFLILMAVARTLTPHDYGQYLFVLSAVLPTYFLLGFGASETFVREAPKLAERGERSEVSALAGATLTVAAGSALLIGAIGGAAIALLPLKPELAGVLRFMLVFFIANGLMFNCAQILLGNGYDKLGAFFFYPALNISLLLSSIPYALLAARPSFGGLAAFTSIGSSLAALAGLAITIAKVRPMRPAAGTMRHLTGAGIKLAAARALYAIGLWLPTFLAGVLLSPVQAGYLGTAGRLAVAVAAVTAAVRFAVRPAIVRAFARQDHEEIRRICGSLAAATFGMACLALAANMLLGRSLVTLVFGPHFAPVAPLLSILLVAIAAESFGGPVDEVLKMTGNENRILTIFGVAVAALAGALFGASRFGVTAMASTQAVYSIAVFGAMIVSVHSSLGIWLHPILPRFRRGARAEELPSPR